MCWGARSLKVLILIDYSVSWGRTLSQMNKQMNLTTGICGEIYDKPIGVWDRKWKGSVMLRQMWVGLIRYFWSFFVSAGPKASNSKRLGHFLTSHSKQGSALFSNMVRGRERCVSPTIKCWSIDCTLGKVWDALQLRQMPWVGEIRSLDCCGAQGLVSDPQCLHIAIIWDFLTPRI